MTAKELAQMIANDINKGSAMVTASVNANGNLVLRAERIDKKVSFITASFHDKNKTVTISSDNFQESELVSVLNIVGNRGDTYFQRWDSVKTYPQSKDDVNQVIDIASVMLETHINLDGRSDLDRGTSKLASVDWTNFGKLNRVYSHVDDFFTGVDTDESLNLDSYRNSMTWSLQKNSNDEVDEWTHVTLTSTLMLDGDKGAVTALRRFGNYIVAFQRTGIAEVLFNSRTQLATEQGVPVEIANTGKVDGKRYITNKYGASNKWAIVEGKLGLYFIDDTNKIIARLTGNGVESLSTKHGFDAWVHTNSDISSWDPEETLNFVAFYDKIHSDIYFLKNQYRQPCLVYNETLDAFTSFFDYAGVPMMTNVSDRFVSFYGGHLWFQNEGLYCNFFGEQKPFWITWRVSPNEFTDKIWTNINYRADFIDVLSDEGYKRVDESDYMGPDKNGTYDPNTTFDSLTVWNEYQTTGDKNISNTTHGPASYPDTRKRFRTWRMTIPRATVTKSNKFGLDRIRNPWVFVKLKKNSDNFGTKMMQLHDVVVNYFEEE